MVGPLPPGCVGQASSSAWAGGRRAERPGAPAPPQAGALPPGIVDYMIEQSGPPSKEVLALKQVQEFLKDGDDVVIIGVFQTESDPAYQLYQDAGEPWPSALGGTPPRGLLLLRCGPGVNFGVA